MNEYGPKVLGPDFEEKRILKNEDVENIEDTQVSSLASAARSYLGSVKQDLHDFDVDVVRRLSHSFMWFLLRSAV